MGLGGPVWHATAAPLPGRISIAQLLRAHAFKAIEGVGDATLGEWEEWTGYAYHVRRRLSTKEQRRYVGEVCDVRGTAEAKRRLAIIARHVPAGVPLEEV